MTALTRPGLLARRFLPDTVMRWSAVMALSLGLLFGPDMARQWVMTPAIPLTVEAVASAARWDPGDRSFMVRSGPWVYHTSCPILWISRTLVTVNDPYVPVAAEAVEGVSGPRTGQATRREFASQAMTIPSSTIRVEVPHGIAPGDVLGIVQDIDVPDNQPCANGYSGRYRMWETVLPVQADEERTSTVRTVGRQ